MAAALGVVQAHPEPAPVVGTGHGSTDDGFWNVVTGFATKTGYRLVFSWDADAPVNGYVEWGTEADALHGVARPPTEGPDTAGIAVVDVGQALVGETIHYRVVDGSTGKASDVHTLTAANGWTTNGTDGPHEIDLIVQVDSEALPSIVPVDQGLRDVSRAVDVMAERIWDATDEHIRIGDVIVTDTVLNYPANVPFGPGACYAKEQVNGWEVQHTIPDIIFQSSVPFDSHTYAGAMSDPCTGIYMGRLGQLVVWWGSVTGGVERLHVGQVLAHEMGHYAMGLPDLYPGPGEAVSSADCWDPNGHDITMMHTKFGWDGWKWEGTELDRNNTLTPCDYGSEDPSWPILANRYPGVPTLQELEDDPNADPYPNQDDSKADVPMGNPDGGELDVYVLDNQPGSSKLVHYIGGNGDRGDDGIAFSVDPSADPSAVAGLLP